MTGWGEWLVIGAVILLVWNARRIPELGGAIAKSIGSFKKGLKGESPAPKEVTELAPPSAIPKTTRA